MDASVGQGAARSAIRWAQAAEAELGARPDLLVSSQDMDDVLGADYRADAAVDLAHACFAAVRNWTYDNRLAHLPMLVVQLSDSTQLSVDPPLIDQLQEDLHEFTPPGLYMCRRTAGLAFPDGEEYMLPVAQDLHTSIPGAVLCYYTCSRSLELRELGGEYTRTVRFVYDHLAGSDSPDRLAW